MEGAYLQPKSLNPKAVAVVVLLHGAALAALITAKGEVFVPFKEKPIVVEFIREVPPPPPEKHETQPTPQHPTMIDIVQPKVVLPPLPQLPFDTAKADPIPLPWTPPGPIDIRPSPPPPIPIHEPVRAEARIDSGSPLQPPYPASAQREGAEGTVRVRVAIGPDGRVKSVQKVEASRDDFFAATERQALRYWRFKPATVDGKPIASSKLMVVHFRIDDLG
jgi:protein TonB